MHAHPEAKSGPLVAVENLEMRFPIDGSESFVQAASGVSFTLEPGETLGLVGESGSGKTTIGRCLTRLLKPTAGAIRFRGEDITRMTERDFRPIRRKMQMVFQEPYYSLNPRYTAWDTIAEPLRLQGQRDRRALSTRVLEIASTVRLDRRKLHAYPHQMSSGEQQRVGIARAFATNPELIVLDEPTSMLDQTVRAEILDLLVGLQRQFGLTYLFISHDLMTVEYLCHRVAVMYLGQIVELGSVRQVFGNPQHPYSRALLSAALPPDPDLAPANYLLSGEIPSPSHLPHGCFLASRCPEVKSACRENRQMLCDVEGGHAVRCWRVADHDIAGWSEEFKQARPREEAFWTA